MLINRGNGRAPLPIAGRTPQQIGWEIRHGSYSFPPRTVREIWRMNNARGHLEEWFSPFFGLEQEAEENHAENLRLFFLQSSLACSRGELRGEDLAWLMDKLHFRLDILAQDCGVHFFSLSRDLDEICSAARRAWLDHFSLRL